MIKPDAIIITRKDEIGTRFALAYALMQIIASPTWIAAYFTKYGITP